MTRPSRITLTTLVKRVAAMILDDSSSPMGGAFSLSFPGGFSFPVDYSFPFHLLANEVSTSEGGLELR